MKLIFIRHGDPDYANDTLTPRGVKEAEALGNYLKKTGFSADAYFCSPLGRAQLTCQLVQKELGFEYETLPWIREFNARIPTPWRTDKPMGFIWDLYPSYFTSHPLLYDSSRWLEDPVMAASDVREKFENVGRGLDEILARYGYIRDGKLFRTEAPNEKTLVFFCHFGVLSVIMAHLSGFSPYVFFQHFCALTTSVTTFATEEREKGVVSFRCHGYSCVDHLLDAGITPSFAARFPEVYHDKTLDSAFGSK